MGAIIWDDASTDNTIEIIKSFKDKRINLLKMKNLGLGQSKIKASKKVNGEFFAILELMINFLQKKLKSKLII